MDEDIRKLFKSGEPITFLVGAGVSMDQPAGLPSARQICQDLFEFFGPFKHFEEFGSITGLRYEMIIEKIQRFYDSRLSIMDFFDLAVLPNINHLFLAGCVIEGMDVLTTNFDCLLELALKRLLPAEQHSRILPVITRRDFEVWKQGTKSPELRVFKIHGSKKNVMTGQDTTESLVTTMTALGQNRDAGQTFGLEAYKRPLVTSLLEGRTVVVLGYSGSDDFDITPALRATPNIKRVVWIDHANIDAADVMQLERRSVDGTNPHASWWGKLPAGGGLEAFIIKANTAKFIRSVLSPLLLGDIAAKIAGIEQDLLAEKASRPSVSFKEWLYARYKDPGPALAMRFGAAIYYDAGLDDRALGQAKSGLNATRNALSDQTLPTAKRASYQRLEHWFINLMGLIAERKGDFKNAVVCFEQAMGAATASGEKTDRAAALNNLGTMLLETGDVERAITTFQSALQADNELNDDRNAGIVLGNLGTACRIMGRFQDAIQYLREALDAASKSGDLSGKFTRLNNLGSVFMDLDRLEDAERSFADALAIATALGDAAGAAIIGRNIAHVQALMGQPDAARRFAIDASRFAETAKSQSARASFLHEQGIALMNKAKFQDGEKMLLDALDIAKKVKNHPLVVKIDIALGTGYIYGQKKDEAEVRFLEGAGLARVLHDDGNELLAEYSLGLVYSVKHLNEQAVERFKIAEILSEKLKDKSRLASTCKNLGELLVKLQKKDDAIKYLNKALLLSGELKDQMMRSSLGYWINLASKLP